MKYFIDTEFHEYQKKPLIGKAIDTIELISIGIVSEDVKDYDNPDYTYTPEYTKVNIGNNDENIPRKHYVNYPMKSREYYAICKDFDLKAAWNSFQLEPVYGDMRNKYPKGIKVYWLRENVLKPVFKELWQKDPLLKKLIISEEEFEEVWETKPKACRGWLKRLINKYGKSRKQIVEEIKDFVKDYKFDDKWEEGDRYESVYGNGKNNTYYFIKDGIKSEEFIGNAKSEGSIEFYGYYADYDWVVFCWLFGRMIDLPKGFPMYCIDLKQMIDSKRTKDDKGRMVGLQAMKSHPKYPKQINEHNALADAKWNKELYEFLNNEL